MRNLKNGLTSPRTARAAVLTLVMAAPFALSACDGLVGGAPPGETAEEWTPEGYRVSYGTPLAMGNGAVRTYFVRDRIGQPSSIGVELSESALTGLPEQMGMHHIPLPPEAKMSTQYTFVMFDWNPQGHDPEGVYTVPHFDFHFYVQDEQEVTTIPGGPDPVPVDPQVVPAGYISPGQASVPAMGVHWVDSSAPELNGGTFTETFIWGSWQGRVTFIEPMITKAFLETRPNLTIPVKQPAVYQLPGFYPETYGIRYDARSKVLRISLDQLVER